MKLITQKEEQHRELFKNPIISAFHPNNHVHPLALLLLLLLLLLLPLTPSDDKYKEESVELI